MQAKETPKDQRTKETSVTSLDKSMHLQHSVLLEVSEQRGSAILRLSQHQDGLPRSRFDRPRQFRTPESLDFEDYVKGVIAQGSGCCAHGCSLRHAH